MCIIKEKCVIINIITTPLPQYLYLFNSIVMIDEFESLFNNNKDNIQIFEIFSLCEFLILIGISNSMEILSVL